MTGMELIAAAAVGYLVRKLRRVGGRADAEVDRALDRSMDALHALVSRVLPDDPALARLFEQAQTTDSEVSERTRRRAADAIADAAQENETFAKQLRELVDELQSQEQATPASAGGVRASDGGVAAGRNVNMHAKTGGVIAPGAGSVNVENKFIAYARRNPLGAAITVIIVLGILTAVIYGITNSGSGLSGSSTCEQYLAASSDDQHAVVNKLATQYGKPDYVSPLGFPEVAYWCTAQPNATLTQFFKNAND